MTLRQAIAIFPQPWIDGGVTFREWLLAGAVIEAAIARDESGAESNEPCRFGWGNGPDCQREACLCKRASRKQKSK
jgi:hypothetical protein